MDKLKLKGVKDYDLDKKKSSHGDCLYILFLQFSDKSPIDSKTIESLFVDCIKNSKDFTVEDSISTKKLNPLIDKVLIDMFLPEKDESKKIAIKI